MQSPPASNTLDTKVQQHSPSPSKLEVVKVPSSPQEPEVERRLSHKRKRSQTEHDLDSQFGHEFAEKRARVALGFATIPGAAASDIYPDNTHLVECWIETLPEPKYSFDKGFKMSQNQLVRKRSSPAMSYSRGVQQGIYPTAHTSKYEKLILKPAGIILSQQIGESAIGDDARKLCQDLLNARYDIPIGSLFDGDLFWKTLDSVRNEGEGDVVRVLQDALIPSVVTLSLRGLLNVDYLKQEVKTSWSYASSFAGPTSCPDLTVGLRPSAFTDLELDKLNRRHQSPNTPSNFTGDMYFPFFSCEAKCGESGLNESDRQNARSAATAINTVLEMYRHGEEARREAGVPSGLKLLHREVLYFSISHDHTIVKIFGHYPLIEENKTYFHQHVIKTFDLSDDDGGNRWKAYRFVRKMYDHFSPIHLRRIRDAISYLPEPEPESLVSTTSVETAADMPNSQEIAASAQGTALSQDASVFKKPRLPPKRTSNADPENGLDLATVLQRELDKQRQDNERQRQESKEELDKQRQESKEQLEQQREQLKQQREQLEQQREQMSELVKALQSLQAQPWAKK